MKDIKVRDTLREIEKEEEFYRYATPVMLFAEAVADTRMEKGGVSIRDIAKCFKKQFDNAELESLVKELQYNECPECETMYLVGEDPRVDMGMKCGLCAYGAEMYQEAKRLTSEKN